MSFKEELCRPVMGSFDTIVFSNKNRIWYDHYNSFQWFVEIYIMAVNVVLINSWRFFTRATHWTYVHERKHTHTQTHIYGFLLVGNQRGGVELSPKTDIVGSLSETLTRLLRLQTVIVIQVALDESVGWIENVVNVNAVYEFSFFNLY